MSNSTAANASVIKNSMFHVPSTTMNPDETPQQSLEKLKDIFQDLDPSMVGDVFAQSGLDFEKAFQNLLEINDDSQSNHHQEQTDPDPAPLFVAPIKPALNPFSEPFRPLPIILDSSAQPVALVPTPLPAQVSVRPPPAAALSGAPKAPGSLSHYYQVPSRPTLADMVKNSPARSNQSKKNGKKNGKTQKQQMAVPDDVLNAIDQGPVLILMRGVPGSGKSHLANHLKELFNAAVFSADQYFERNGSYQFEPYNLSIAHDWNRKRAEKAIVEGKTPIIIDNTNLQGHEMKPYAWFAHRHHYKVLFLEPLTSWRYKARECAHKNSHDVPQDKIQRMLDNFDRRITVEHLLQGAPPPPPKPEASGHLPGCSGLRAFGQALAESRESTPSPGPTAKPDSTTLNLDELRSLNLDSNTNESDESSQKATDTGSVQDFGPEWEPDQDFIFEPNQNPKPQRHRACTSGGSSAARTASSHSTKILGCPISVDSDWSESPYPDGPKKRILRHKREKIFIKSSCTQTSTADFARLELLNSGEGNEEFVTIESSKDEISIEADEGDENIVKESERDLTDPRIDKGTSCIDFFEVRSKDESIELLKQEFPKATDAIIQEIFVEKCKGDIEWTRNLLGMFEEDHFESDFPDSRETSPDADEYQIPQEFRLELPPEFVAQLVDAFGPIGSTAYNVNSVALTHGVAHLIHHILKKQNSEETEELTPAQLTALVSEIDGSDPSSSGEDAASPSGSRGSFDAIMELQLRMLLQQEQEQEERTETRHQFATKMKREQLKLGYPGVAEEYLEATFAGNEYHFGRTLTELEKKYGPNKILDDYRRRKTEENEIKLAQLLSLKDQPPSIHVVSKKSLLELRQQYDALDRDRQQLNQKTHAAISSKLFSAASHYRERKEVLASKMLSLSREIVAKQSEYCKSSKSLDLHGFKVAQVMPLLKEFLKQREEEHQLQPHRKTTLEIITGYGKSGTSPKIKPMVEQYLRMNNYRFEYPPSNPGMVRVLLTK